MRAWLIAALSAATLTAGASLSQRPAGHLEVLDAVGGVPAHLAGAFEDPTAFQQAPDGIYFVFDRRAHAVYVLDPAMTGAKRIVSIGPEAGRLLDPTAFDLGTSGVFVVADAPNLVERVQFFNTEGARVGGFAFPGRASPRVAIGAVVLSGIGSLQFTGRSVLVNQPETGSLVTEYGLAGTPVRTFGSLRPTGHESDRNLHLALNTGLPLVNPAGGFYFVFLTGEPRFRKYGRDGNLEFERVVQGRELDPLLGAMPERWPRRRIGDEELPLVLPVVRAAAVDAQGRVWISLAVPYTYVFDANGDKVRTVQLRGAQVLTPTSLFFAPNGRLLVTPGLYAFDPR